MSFKKVCSFLALSLSVGIVTPVAYASVQPKLDMRTDPLEPRLKAGLKPTYVRVNLQDSSVASADANIHKKIPHKVLTGPSDKEFQVQNLNLAPDSNGDFIATNYTAAQQRGLNIYALTRIGADAQFDDWLLLRDLNPSNSLIKGVITNYKRGYTPIKLYDAGEDANAYYTRYLKSDGTMQREAHFMHYTGKDGKVRYASASSDIIYHELLGHGYLDEHLPQLLDDSSLASAGFHEGFADAETILLTLRYGQQRKALIDVTKGKAITGDNFMSNLAEDFGNGLGMTAIRDLNIEEALSSSVPQECHEWGRIYWASAMWDIFKGGYNFLVTNPKATITNTDRMRYLDDAAQYLQMSMSLAITSTGKYLPGVPDFASQMYSFAADPKQKVKLFGSSSSISSVPWDQIIKNAFNRRGVSVNGGSGRSAVGLLASSVGQKVALCGTIHNHLGDSHKHDKSKATIEEINERDEKLALDSH